MFEPMQSGDGLLLRVKPRASRLDAEAARRLADAARRHGNGAIELTNRGNLQFRGFTAASAAAFAAQATAWGLADADPASERRHNVLVSPLAGCDPDCDVDTLAVARALGDALATDRELDRLPGKFGLVVDGGGALRLDTVRADVALRASGDGWRVEAGGAMACCDAADAPVLALRLAHAALADDPPSRPARSPEHGSRLFRIARLGWEPVASVAETAPVAVGPLPGGAFGIGLPPGRLDAALLHTLAGLAEHCGDGILRVSPWRSVLLAGLRPGGEAVVRDGAAGRAARSGGSAPAGLVRASARPAAPAPRGRPRRMRPGWACCCRAAGAGTRSCTCRAAPRAAAIPGRRR